MATVIEDPVEREIEQAPASCTRKFTVREYYLMAKAGVFGPDERIELLEGEIVNMSPKGNRHSASTSQTARYFIGLLGNRVIVRIQDPVHLNEYSEPEPDIVLAIPDAREYATHHPTAQEALFILEIADTTLARDRRKAALYARSGVIQYAILNVNKDELEDYRDPDENGYRSKQTYKADESFSLTAFPDVLVNVRDLLPPR